MGQPLDARPRRPDAPRVIAEDRSIAEPPIERQSISIQSSLRHPTDIGAALPSGSHRMGVGTMGRCPAIHVAHFPGAHHPDRSSLGILHPWRQKAHRCCHAGAASGIAGDRAAPKRKPK